MNPKVGAVARIAQSSATAHVAVIGASGGIAVCDLGDRSVKQRLAADQAWSALAFAPDGHTLAATGAHGTAMWDTILWQPRPAPGGKDPATHVAFWRGGTVIVTAGADGAIRIFDLATRQVLTTLSAAGAGNAPIVSIDLADDGRTIAASNAAGVTIWDSVARSSRAISH
jgi:WD40 repeat protein